MPPRTSARQAPAFVYGVEPSTNSGWKNLKKGVKRCDPRFPTLHEYVGRHPQLQLEPLAGQRTYVLFTENDPVKKKEWARQCRDIEIPLGYSQEMGKKYPGKRET